MANNGLNTGINTTVPQVAYLNTNNVQPNQTLNNQYQGMNTAGQGFLGGLGSIFGFGKQTVGPDSRVYGSDILKNVGGIVSNTGDFNTAQQWVNDTIGKDYRVQIGKDGKYLLQKSYVDENGNTSFKDISDKDVVAGDDGTTWNFNAGQMLGNMQNILNIGNSGWGLYANIQNYKQNKELASKQKELLEQQIQNNKDNMAYLKQERERQDTQRRNVAAQRTSESSIRNF